MILSHNAMTPIDFDGLRIFDYTAGVKRGQRFSYSNHRSELAILVLVHTPGFDLRDEVFVGRQ